MNLFNGSMKQEFRIAYVAKLMGFNPNKSMTWPKDIIERILKECEADAETILRFKIQKLMSKP